MPISEITVDGQVYEIEHDEAATDEEIINALTQSLEGEAPQVGPSGLTQEEIRARRLAGVPIDPVEEELQIQQLLKEGMSTGEGFLAGLGAVFTNMGLNVQRLLGVEGAEEQAKEEALLQERLKTIAPIADVADEALLATSLPLSGAAAAGLATRLGGGLGARLAGTAIVGGTEAGALAKPEQDVGTQAALGAALSAGLGGAAELAGPIVSKVILRGKDSAKAVARKAKDLLAKQNQQAAQNLDDTLALLAPKEAVDVFQVKAKETANKAIEVAKELREAKTSPLYNTAFQEGRGVNIDISSLVDDVSTQISSFTSKKRGEVRKALEKAVDQLVDAKNNPLNDLKSLHNSKIEITALANKSKDASIRRKLFSIRGELDEIMSNTVPSYRQANQAYHLASGPVNALEEGLIGRVAQLSDAQLGQVSNKLLSPTNVSGREVAQIRKVFEGVPGGDVAWREVIRGEIENRVNKVAGDLADPGAEVTENIAKQLQQALFKTEKQRNTLFRAVDTETAANLKLLNRILKRGGQRFDILQTLARTQPEKEGLAKTALRFATGRAGFDDMVAKLTENTDDLVRLSRKIDDDLVRDTLQEIRQSLKSDNKVKLELVEQLQTQLRGGAIIATPASSQGEQ